MRTRMMDEPKKSSRQADIEHRYSTLAFDLPEVTWEGLDDKSKAELRQQYGSLASMMLGIFEVALLDPTVFQFTARLINTNLDMVREEMAKKEVS